MRTIPLRAALSPGLAASLAVLFTASTLSAQERPLLDIAIFAEVGEPGQPEGIALAEDGTVYVGTHTPAAGSPSGAPSKLFAWSPEGVLLRDYTVSGQDLQDSYGVLGLAFDGDGLLYALDRAPPRMLRIEPVSGAQTTYATFRDVLPCDQGGTPGDCSAGVLDLGAFADYLVFGPDGTAYVTDLEQALIWRVPPGGGAAEVWFTDARLEGVFGPNGIQFMADGETLLFAQTGSQPPGTTDPGTGVLYTLPVLANGDPGELEVFWEGLPVDGPDGFAIAASGNVYVALAGANQVLLLAPDGQELARVPATPAENALLPVPLDNPASLAFLGESVLVTNQSFFAGNPDSWVVYDVHAGEPGLPLFRPLPEPGPAAGLAAGVLALAALRRRPARSRRRGLLAWAPRPGARLARGRPDLPRDPACRERPRLPRRLRTLRLHPRCLTPGQRSRERFGDERRSRLGRLRHRPRDVLIAYTEAGIHWHDDLGELADKIYLNAGELPPTPCFPSAHADPRDCNGDG